MPIYESLPQAMSGGTEINPCAACPVRDMSVCSALAPDEIGRLNEIVQTFAVDPHDPVFDEGEPAEFLFNITAGTIKLYKLMPDGRRAITGFLGPGDFLGLPVKDQYAYSAEAVTRSQFCRFPRKRMDQLLEEFPKLQRRLFSMAANELAAAQDQMLLLGRKTAKEKICSFLLLQSERASRRGMKPNPIDVPMSRSDIADYLGLTTETVSRTFTQLKSNGVIRLLEGHRVDLVDLDRLTDIADGV